MPELRQFAATATDLACRTAGRRQVVRASRFVLRRARLDVPNHPSTNGEASLQRWIMRRAPSGRRVHVVDVGANTGQWSGSMLAAARQAGRLGDLDLHAFEPSAVTFGRLAAALAGNPVTLRRAALGDRPGTATLHVAGPGAGTNSLHPLPPAAGAAVAGQVVPAARDAGTERVTVTTLDDYAEQAGLDRIALLKVDTEGNDLAVLAGARSLLAGQRISVAQFEYNQRWIMARAFLRDAFELLGVLGYALGKLTPRGVEFYPRWDADLETFVEGNYVACTAAAAGGLPLVKWWKSDG
jgi:FkbM family methyltransferase